MINCFRNKRPAARSNRFAFLLALANTLLAFSSINAFAQSTRPGLGSTPYADSLGTGVTFRVWAPNATAVTVPGVFNGWSLTANALVREGTNGVWSADISTARPGQEYKYYINN